MTDDTLNLDALEAKADSDERYFRNSIISHEQFRALIAAARERDALKAEVVTYLALWAAHSQVVQDLNGLHPKHFDRLKELGARMDDFKRANIDGD